MIAIEATIVSTAMPQIAGPAGRPAPLRLGVLRLPADPDGHHRRLRQARRPLRAQAGSAGRDRHLPRRDSRPLRLRLRPCRSLIAFRLLQGVGGGAIQPISAHASSATSTRARERGKVQGWLASVWGDLLRPRPAGRRPDHSRHCELGLGVLDQRPGRACAAAILLHACTSEGGRAAAADLHGSTFLGAALFTVSRCRSDGGAHRVRHGQPHRGRRAAMAGPLRRSAPCPLRLAGTAGFAGPDDRHSRCGPAGPSPPRTSATLLSGMTIIGLTTFLPMYVQGVLGQLRRSSPASR